MGCVIYYQVTVRSEETEGEVTVDLARQVGGGLDKSNF